MALGGAFALGGVGAVVGLLPQFDVVKSARPLSDLLVSEMAPGDTYAIYPRIDPTFIFYTHKHAEVLNGEDELFAYAARRDGVWLLAERQALAKLSRPLPMVEVARDHDGDEGYTLFRQQGAEQTGAPAKAAPEPAPDAVPDPGP